MIQEKELDLMELLRTLYGKRKQIIRNGLIGAVLGAVIGLLSPKEYACEVKLLPEISADDAGGSNKLLQKIGGLTGISFDNMGGGFDVVRPDLYPNILSSTDFMVQLMSDTFFIDGQKMTLEHYFLEEKPESPLTYVKSYTVGLPGKIMSALGSSESTTTQAGNQRILKELRLSEDQLLLIEELRGLIGAELDFETGIFRLKVNMPTASLAVQVADYSYAYLTRYMTDYRSKKAQEDFQFISARAYEAQQEFEAIQLQLATFKDGHQNMWTESARVELRILENRYNLKYGIYKSLADKKEELGIHVQNSKPVFQLLESPTYPIKKSKPQRMMLLALALVLAIVATVGWILLKPIALNLWEALRPSTESDSNSEA